MLQRKKMWHNNKTLISAACGSIPLLNGEPCLEATSILGIVSAMLLIAIITIGIITYRCFKRSKMIEVKTLFDTPFRFVFTALHRIYEVQ